MPAYNFKNPPDYPRCEVMADGEIDYVPPLGAPFVIWASVREDERHLQGTAETLVEAIGEARFHMAFAQPQRLVVSDGARLAGWRILDGGKGQPPAFFGGGGVAA